MNMNLSLYIVGAGGHGRVVASSLKSLNRQIHGFVETDLAKVGQHLFDIPIFEQKRWLEETSPDHVVLANGLGSVGDTTARRQMYEKFVNSRFQFISVIHPRSIIAEEARIDEGVQIMAGAVIQVGVHLSANCIVNTGAVIDHDCVIGKHSHIAPGAVLSGDVYVEESCHVGVGAVVLQGVRLGQGCVVGAGAVVRRDVLPFARVVGVPARPLTPDTGGPL